MQILTSVFANNLRTPTYLWYQESHEEFLQLAVSDSK